MARDSTDSLSFMFLQLQHQSLSLGRKPLGFTQHYYTEWDDGQGKDRIAFFLLLAVTSTQVPSEEIAKEAFQLLQDHFLDDLKGDPYDRFEAALREVNQMVVAKERELEVKFIPNVHVLCGVLNKDLLFLSQRGEAQGYLLRKRHVSLITDGLSDDKNKEDLFQNIASGVLDVGDNVVFSTGALVQYVTPNDLAKIYSDQSLEQANSELKDLLKQDIEDQMAVLTFEVLEKTEILHTQPEKPEPVAAVVKMGDEEEEDHPMAGHASLFDAEDFSPKQSSREARREQLKAALARLRRFEGFQDRFGFLLKMRQWSRPKLLSAILAIGLFTIVAIVGLGYSLNQSRALEASQEKLDQASQNVGLASTKGTFNKEEAQVLLNAAEDLAKEVLASGKLGGAASEVLASIQEQRDFLDNVIHLDDELVQIADFSGQLTVGTRVLGMEPSEDRLVVYSEDKAFQVLTDQVQTPVVIEAGEKVVAAHDMPDYNRTLMLTLSGKLLEFTQGNTQFADTADGTWHEGVDLATFSNKVYVLDPGSNQVWKYQRNNDAYGAASAYLSGEVDLSTAVSMAIDGKVWVLENDGTILQFLSGKPVKYTLKKKPASVINSASRIYTEADINQLYVLDSANRRLLVFDKSKKTDDLTYASQFVFDTLSKDTQLTDVYMDRVQNKLLITTDKGLYEIKGTN